MAGHQIQPPTGTTTIFMQRNPGDGQDKEQYGYPLSEEFYPAEIHYLYDKNHRPTLGIEGGLVRIKFEPPIPHPAQQARADPIMWHSAFVNYRKLYTEKKEEREPLDPMHMPSDGSFVLVPREALYDILNTGADKAKIQPHQPSQQPSSPQHHSLLKDLAQRVRHFF